MKRVSSKKGGFTLIELLVVISIIGMLSSVVLVSLQSARDKGKVGAGQVFDTNLYHTFGAEAVAIYNFDDLGSTPPFKDISGNNNNLSNNSPNVCSGATQDSTITVQGKSLLLSGTTNCLFNIPASSKQISPTNGAVSFWINPISYGNLGLIMYIGRWITLCTPSTGKGGSIYIGDNGGDTSCNGNFISTSKIPVNNNIWTHVAISWGTGNTQIYINGKKDATITGIPTSVASPLGGSTFIIGNWQANGDNFVGRLDQVSVYTQSLQAP